MTPLECQVPSVVGVEHEGEGVGDSQALECYGTLNCIRRPAWTKHPCFFLVRALSNHFGPIPVSISRILHLPPPPPVTHSLDKFAEHLLFVSRQWERENKEPKIHEILHSKENGEDSAEM